MTTKEKVFRNVKALAQTNSMTMKEVEEEIGRKPGYLSRKTANVGLDDVTKLCNVFGISMRDILENDYEMELRHDTALRGLRAAIKAASEYFDDETLLGMISGMLQEGGDANAVPV